MRSQSGRSLGGGGRGGFGMPGFSPGGRGGGGDRFGYNDPRGFSGGPMGPPDRFGGPGRDSFSRGGGFSGPRERGGPSGGMAPPALAPRPPPRVEPTMGPRDDGWRGRGDRPAAGGAATPSAGGAAEAQAQAGSQPVSHAETPRESIGADKVRQRAKGTMEEFQSGALKANGVAEEYRDVKQLGGSGGTFLASFVREGITGRGARWAPCLELMQQLAREGMVEGGDLQDAAAELVGSLEGDREDNLHSAEYVGSLLAAVECAGVDLAEVLRGALEAGEEPFEEGDPYGLVECGGGAELLLCTLQDLAKEDKGKVRQRSLDQRTRQACAKVIGDYRESIAARQRRGETRRVGGEEGEEVTFPLVFSQAEALWKSIGKPFTDFLSSMDRDDPGRALKKHPDLDFLL